MPKNPLFRTARQLGNTFKDLFAPAASPSGAETIRQNPEGSSGNATRKSGLRFYEVLPQLTDKAIDDWLDPHLVAVDLTVPSRNQLFLFLPGSYGTAKGQRLILQEALAMGYHVVSLNYPNSWSVYDLCRRSPDADCHGKARRAILQGSVQSGEVSISQANSIENRLIKLLHYLSINFASEGWSAFLRDHQPRWDRLVVAGHSQGGGHAAMLGMYHQVGRVVMLAAPADFSKALSAPAPWLSQPHVTPAERYFGFTHMQDPGFGRLREAWRRLGLSAFGPLVDIDTQQPPFSGSHQLMTNTLPGRPGKYHGSIAVDACLPQSGAAQKRLQQAWKYLLEVN